jgi:enamine deaminase RidA (YjgF/YER057c/UK114 family)
MKLSIKTLSAGTILTLIGCILIVLGYHNKMQQNGTAQAQEKIPDAEHRIKELGIQLRTPAPPVANYVNAVRAGDLVFLAGHGPQKADGTWVTGKVGRDMGIDEAKEAARLTAINMLSSLKAEIGDLNKVKRIVKVLGMVNSDVTFTDQPKVINGCSDLLVSVFGERGKHARAAVGMVSLPFGIPVEIEMIVEVEEK